MAHLSLSHCSFTQPATLVISHSRPSPREIRENMDNSGHVQLRIASICDDKIITSCKSKKIRGVVGASSFTVASSHCREGLCVRLLSELPAPNTTGIEFGQ